MSLLWHQVLTAEGIASKPRRLPVDKIKAAASRRRRLSLSLANSQSSVEVFRERGKAVEKIEAMLESRVKGGVTMDVNIRGLAQQIEEMAYNTTREADAAAYYSQIQHNLSAVFFTHDVVFPQVAQTTYTYRYAPPKKFPTPTSEIHTLAPLERNSTQNYPLPSVNELFQSRRQPTVNNNNAQLLRPIPKPGVVKIAVRNDEQSRCEESTTEPINTNNRMRISEITDSEDAEHAMILSSFASSFSQPLSPRKRKRSAPVAFDASSSPCTSDGEDAAIGFTNANKKSRLSPDVSPLSASERPPIVLEPIRKGHGSESPIPSISSLLNAAKESSNSFVHSPAPVRPIAPSTERRRLWTGEVVWPGNAPNASALNTLSLSINVRPTGLEHNQDVASWPKELRIAGLCPDDQVASSLHLSSKQGQLIEFDLISRDGAAPYTALAQELALLRKAAIVYVGRRVLLITPNQGRLVGCLA